MLVRSSGQLDQVNFPPQFSPEQVFLKEKRTLLPRGGSSVTWRSGSTTSPGKRRFFGFVPESTHGSGSSPSESQVQRSQLGAKPHLD
jgi:hypothetical protein